MSERLSSSSRRAATLVMAVVCVIATWSMSSATPTSAAASNSGIGRLGTELTLDGRPHLFSGLNVYELASQYGENGSCGAELSNAQLESFFASLAPGTLVRFAAGQENAAINIETHALDWKPLDRVFAAAARHNIYLIPVLGLQQTGNCNSQWPDLAWYQGGYAVANNTPGATGGRQLRPYSYLSYVSLIVSRYASAKALGMWEPMGEAEDANCPPAALATGCWGSELCPDERTAATVMRAFYDRIGALIHARDPNHLVEAGLLGGGQCGSYGSDMAVVGSSPGIDVLSYHDYFGLTPDGGDPINGIDARLLMARALGKPLIIGELGMNASANGVGCMGYSARSSAVIAKASAQFARGSAAELIWNWSPDPPGPCSYNTGNFDPLMSMFTAVARGTAKPSIGTLHAPRSNQSVITISGTNLGDPTSVSIDGNSVPFTSLGPTTISAITGVAPGVHLVAVTTPAGSAVVHWNVPPMTPPCPVVVHKISVSGQFCAEYELQDGIAGPLGPPLARRVGLHSGGVTQRFQYGAIYSSATTGTHALIEDVFGKYLALGGPHAGIGDNRTPLGLPTSEVVATNNLTGRTATFIGAEIFASDNPAIGVHLIGGAMLKRYLGLGSTGSALGFPMTDESPSDGRGRWARFEGGFLFWSAAHGTHLVVSPILKAYLTIGDTKSKLGYPTNDPVALSGGGVSQQFEGGTIVQASPGAPVVVTFVHGRIRHEMRP